MIPTFPKLEFGHQRENQRYWERCFEDDVQSMLHTVKPAGSHEEGKDELEAAFEDDYFPVSLEDSTVPVRSQTWCNIGWWDEKRGKKLDVTKFTAPLTYTLACEKLAMEVAERCAIRGSILEIRCGSGDSLLLWFRLAKQQGHALRKVVAVTPTRRECRAARKLVKEAANAKLLSPDSVEILHGSASRLFEHEQLEMGDEIFNAIIAIDSLYYLRNRVHFLQEAIPLLLPGGSFVASDLAVGPVWGLWPAIWTVLSYCWVLPAFLQPSALPTPLQYAGLLRELRMEDVKVEVATQNTIQGFTKHCGKIGFLGSPPGFWPFKFLAWLLDFVVWIGLVQYVIVSARKPLHLRFSDDEEALRVQQRRERVAEKLKERLAFHKRPATSGEESGMSGSRGRNLAKQ